MNKQQRKLVNEGKQKANDFCKEKSLFCHVTVTSTGDWDGIEHVMKGFNIYQGSEKLSVAIIANNDDFVHIYIHFPIDNEKYGITSMDWVTALSGTYTSVNVSVDGEYTKIDIPKDEKSNIYPLKERDVISSRGFSFLRKHNLIVDEEDDEDYTIMAENAGITW